MKYITWKGLFFSTLGILVLGMISLIVACSQGEASEVEYVSELNEVAAEKTKKSLNPKVGEAIDEFNNIAVYFNGMRITETVGRHKSPSGYNYGLKWQCVEFVKRYYYDYLEHAMPDPWGHAISFFDPALSDGAFNRARNLYQFKNFGRYKPHVNDIVVFGGTTYNSFGHVGIITKISDRYLEIIQQNVGTTTREMFILKHKKGRWFVHGEGILGWLGHRPPIK